jgi:2-dehydropantoate 2-reductase
VKPIAIFGLGALGSVFAALFASANLPVIGVCRSLVHRKAVQEQGLLFRDGERERRVPFPVYAELPDQPCSLVLVLVKAFDTQAAAGSMAGRIDPLVPVLTLQNGIGNAEILAARLKPDQVLAGTTTFGALMEEPGAVRLTGRGECEIGALDAPAQQHLPRIQELFRKAEIPCRFSSNIAATLWKKLAVNAVINPLTALLRLPNGDLLEHAALQPLFTAITEEVWRVAARCQVPLPTPPELASEVRRVCQLTAANQSSMFRDVEARGRTEIDAINGAVVRLGRERGVLAPVNLALTAMVQAASSVPK